MSKNSPRVLVVDDEPHVRHSLRRVLSRDFEVVLADSADASSHLIEQNERFDALLLDLVMKGRTGMDLFRWIGSNSPELVERVVFMSGGATTESSREFVRRHARQVMFKPLDTAELRGVFARLAGRSQV